MMNGKTLGVSFGLVTLLGTAVLLAAQHKQVGVTPSPESTGPLHQSGNMTVADSPSESCCQDGAGRTAADTCCQEAGNRDSATVACCQTGVCEECEAGETCADEKPADGSESSTAATIGLQQGRRGPPAGRGPGQGNGFQGGRGPGRGAQNGDDQFQEDHNVFFYLLDHRDAITRTVTNLDDGIETVTESGDPDVTAKIQEHVAAMYNRIENVNPIHMRDPLFRELFANADRIHMEMHETPKGIRVKETSTDPYVARLLQEHAKTVSLFIKNGREELHRNHPLPQKPDPDQSASIIKGHGRVVRLPDAAAQPRDQSKLCIDVTTGGPPHELNPAIDRIARYVNIYAAAGDQPATAEFTVVLHGDATEIALSDEAYAARFGTKDNPNLALIRRLRQAGVEFLVCGQSLAGKSIPADEADSAVEVAVSALTANVNCQQDGYVVISLN